jgi:phage N-6-adenine-methyltransferase
MEETSIESAVRHGREGAESMLERLTSELAEETEHPPASNEGFFALSKRIGEAFSHQAERAAALDGVTDALSVWSALPRGGLVGFRAKNHPQQVGTNGADDDDVDDRRTPSDFWEELHEAHRFTLDASASKENAKCAKFFDRETNGLSQSWAGEITWCNPPFSDVRSWVNKAITEVRKGCPKVVMLLPANRCEQPWWQDYVEPIRDGRGRPDAPRITTWFIPGRLRFGARSVSDDAKKPGENRPPFGCVVLVIEPPVNIGPSIYEAPMARRSK